MHRRKRRVMLNLAFPLRNIVKGWISDSHAFLLASRNRTMRIHPMHTRASNQKNPAAVALGRLGASKGGLARAKKLSAQERSRIARIAALRRWTTQDSGQ